MTVPVLVYCFGIEPALATTYSLCIVGIASFSGSVNFFIKKMIDFRVVILFGIPSIVSVLFARRIILPNIPAKLDLGYSIYIMKNDLLMILFSIAMLLSALSMIKKKDRDIPIQKRRPRTLKLLLFSGSGMLSGLVTGLLGAGGGFLIIPVLVLLFRLPMKKAIATSLAIITINSIFGFSFSLQEFGFDWILFWTITCIAVTGIFIGNRLAAGISPDALKKWFGFFLLAIAFCIMTQVVAG